MPAMQRPDPRESPINRLLSGLTSNEIGLLVIGTLVVLVIGGAMFCAGSEPSGDTPGNETNDRAHRRRLEEAQREIEEWRERARRAERRNEELSEDLAETRELLDRQAEDPDDGYLEEVTRFQRQVSELQIRVDEQRRELSETRAGRHRAERRVAELEDRVATLEQRNIELEEEARRLREERDDDGNIPRTGDFQSCWLNPDGEDEYIWDVTIHRRGILLRAGPAPFNEHQRNMLPVSDIAVGEYLSDADFLSQTQELYDYSIEEACRFFVRVFDDTGTESGALYGRRLEVVRRRFQTDEAGGRNAPRP